MNKLSFVIPVVALTVWVVASTAQAQQRGGMGPYYEPGYGPEWQQQGERYCPYCGRYLGPHGYGMGPGTRGRGYGYGMGRGMMHRDWRGQGYGMGPGMMHRWPGRGGYGPQYDSGYQEQEPLEKEEAKKLVERTLSDSRNPNLKVGDIRGKEGGYEVDIITKDGSMVDKVFVDKVTGWMRSIY